MLRMQMAMRCAVILICFWLISLSVGGTQRPSPEVTNASRIARIENGLLPGITIKGTAVSKMKLVDRMKHYNVPGVSIAFFEGGQISWTRTYGFADVSRRKPITPDTLFEAGSISKPTTALAVLRLVQEGKLDLDEDVNMLLKEWKLPSNEFTTQEKVTLRRLLSHSAGLGVHGFDGYPPNRPLPTLFQILDGTLPANSLPVRVIATPGTIWRYSGGGYVITQLLLTETLNEPFPRILQDLVLNPAGMFESTFEQPLPSKRSLDAAIPYRFNGQPVEGGSRTYPEMAAAGLWTNPSDLAHLMIEVQKEYAGQSETILSRDTARQMLARQKDNWGLGFAIESPGREMRFGHGGSDEGFESRVEAYVKSGQGMVIMTNGARGSELIREILCAVSEEYRWPDFHPVQHTTAQLSPKTLGGLVGSYQFSDASKINVVLKKGHLYIEGLDAQPQELLPETETQFFMLTDAIIVQVHETNQNMAEALTVYDGGDVLEARKLSTH